MRRRLLNFLAAASLAVCVAICVLWVRSTYVTDMRRVETGHATYDFASSGGVVAVYRIAPADGEIRWQRPAVQWSVLGLELIDGRFNRRRPWKLLLVPYWIPAGVAMIVPGAWLLARARREARARQASREEGHETAMENRVTT